MITNVFQAIKGSSGATLVELLVTLSITAVLFVVLSQAVSFGVRVWERGDNYAGRESQSWSGEAYLYRILSVARPPTSRNSDQTAEEFLFKGSRQSVSFVTGPIRQSARIGLVFVRIEVSKTPQGQILTLRWSPVSAVAKERGLQTGRKERTVIGPVEAIWFSFAGQNEGYPELQWHSEWLDQDRLPIAIKIMLRIRRGGSSEERELLIPTRLGHFSPLAAPKGDG